MGAPASAAEFVAAAGSVDLFVIRSSELALQRSSSARVRDFAARMIEAHKGTSGQLSLAGRRLNLLPSASLRPAHQAMLDALANSASFDPIMFAINGSCTSSRLGSTLLSRGRAGARRFNPSRRQRCASSRTI
jgi:putative membrane protein